MYNEKEERLISLGKEVIRTGKSFYEYTLCHKPIAHTSILITPVLCSKHPRTLFVFGDNLIHKGESGQAIIRNCVNSIGVLTKKYPSNNVGSFLDDKEDSWLLVNQSLIELYLFSLDYDRIHIPTEIGKGRSDMFSKAPLLYLYLRSALGLPL